MTTRSDAPIQTSTPRLSAGERRARERRALWIGLVASVVIHLVVIGFVGSLLHPDPRDRSRPTPREVVVLPPPGIRAVELRLEGEEAPAEPDRPSLPESDEEPVIVAVDTTAAVVVAREAADDRTAADRLSPRVVDPRLWEPMVLIPAEPTLEDVEARLGAAIEMLSDSALAETDRALRARDWTVEDGRGGRWGVSPGKLHLGSLTLPLPIWFPEDPNDRLANDMWYEIQAQADRARFLESFEDRVRAIRERRDREREQSRTAENGGG